MVIELTHDEVEMLANLVERKTSDMELEINHTSTREFREYLKEQKHAMEQISRHLQACLRPAEVAGTVLSGVVVESTRASISRGSSPAISIA